MSTDEIIVAILLVAASYAAGSIPFGVVVSRLTGAPDPRTLGSGRTGGTNALRAMGRKRALVVVTGDVLKGAVPVLVARYVTGNAAVEVLCAVFARSLLYRNYKNILNWKPIEAMTTMRSWGDWSACWIIGCRKRAQRKFLRI